MNDSGNIFYTAGYHEHYIKISQCATGVDACNVSNDGKTYCVFVPWCSIIKIEYDVVEG